MLKMRIIGPLLACLAFGCTEAPIPAEDEILRPEAAFPYTAEATASAIAVRFEVLDGYYLYRDRFGFESRTDGVTLAATRFPQGENHWDEFFGDQEIYRHEFEILLPYTLSASVDSAVIGLKLQGCADAGLCYPPQDWEATVALPPAAAAVPAASPGAARGGFVFGASDDEPLQPEDAFSINARFDGPNELVVSWLIEPGYYLYRHMFEFSTASAIGLGAPSYPAGVERVDESYGEVEVYYDYVEVSVPFSRASPDELAVVVEAAFQGCKEGSICYPPMQETLSLTLPATSEFAVTGSEVSGSATGSGSGSSSGSGATGPVSEQDSLADLILNGSPWAMLATFYGLGLLLSFTPCVLPMVPILSSIIVGAGGESSTSRGFALSLAYVLGMAVTYTVAGALSALAGQQVQAIFQQPWIIVTFAGLFVALSLGMFGLYELQMPSAIQSRIANMANRQQSGTYFGTAFIGALSALIVTACVAPPLIAALAVIGQSGDVTRGSAALFAMSIGMGTPLMLLGASAGTILPKVGPWMNAMKGAFGIMMLAVAIYMLERILPGSVTLALWALLVFMTGVFLGALEPLPASPGPQARLRKGFGLLACLYGALMLIGALTGGEDPLRPIPQRLFASGPGTGADAAAIAFEPIETVAQLDAALVAARDAGRPVFVDFTADWCSTCKELERYTFPEPVVIAALEPFVSLKIDVTENNEDDQALLDRFDAIGPPTLAFFDSSGREQPGYELVRYMPADEFVAHVTSLAAL